MNRTVIESTRAMTNGVLGEIAKIEEFLRDLRPFVIRDIKLSNVVKAPNPTNEVVMPAGPNLLTGSSTVGRALKLVSKTARRGRGMGRGAFGVRAQIEVVRASHKK